MIDKHSAETPLLETPLEPGEGRLINLIAEYASESKDRNDRERWKPLIEYLNTGGVSDVAQKLGLAILGEKSEADVGETLAKVANWYLSVAKNETRLSKKLHGSDDFKPEP